MFLTVLRVLPARCTRDDEEALLSDEYQKRGVKIGVQRSDVDIEKEFCRCGPNFPILL
jgi:hypothetical protein